MGVIGAGDNLMATGMARGAHARGKRIAFGDGHQIIWDHHSPEIFRNNPNIAPPGSEGSQDLEWIAFYRGNRQYNTHNVTANKWEWNYQFRPKPGEIFFDQDEAALAARTPGGFVLIEPHVVDWKSSAANKRWPIERYEKIARYLRKEGATVCQFDYGPSRVDHAQPIKTKNFRSALAVLSKAKLYIGPEGGLHHGAAAVGIPAVVIFGGFIPPEVTGYDTHTNLTGGAKACGSLSQCQHCREALLKITPHHVMEAARRYL